MNIRRLRRLAGLRESIADDPHTNAAIEQAVSSYPSEHQIIMLDALEALKNAGPDGLVPRDWAERVRAIHSDPEMALSDLLKIVAAMPFVRRTSAGSYAWVSAPAPIPDDEISRDPQSGLIRQQIDLADDVLKLMRDTPSFTVTELARLISAQSGVPTVVANQLADHFMTTFRHTLEPAGPGGRMRVKDEVVSSRDGNMSLFRDLASRPTTSESAKPKKKR